MIGKRLIGFFVAPALIVYLCFFLIPTGFTFYFSLFEWSGFGTEAKFIGLGNYRRLWNDPTFWLSFRNSLALLFVGGFFVFFLAFLYTILISSGIWGKKLFRLELFLPNVVSVVALSAMRAHIDNPRYGLLNSSLKAVGLDEMGRTLWTSPDNIF